MKSLFCLMYKKNLRKGLLKSLLKCHFLIIYLATFSIIRQSLFNRKYYPKETAVQKNFQNYFTLSGHCVSSSLRGVLCSHCIKMAQTKVTII